MRSFIFLLLLSTATSVFAQQWPWFFLETAFKKWVIDKNVKCLKYVVHNDLPYSQAKFNDGSYYINKENTEYYFDKKGVPNFVRQEWVTLYTKAEDAITERDYHFMVGESIPEFLFRTANPAQRKLSYYDEAKSYMGIGKNLQDTLRVSQGGFFLKSPTDENELFELRYKYRLNQEVHYEYGEVAAVNFFSLIDDSDFPVIGVICFAPLNDSLSLLSLKVCMTLYEGANYSKRDSLVEYPFYRKMSADKSKLEFGIRIIDSLGFYHYYPLQIKEEKKTSDQIVRIVSEAQMMPDEFYQFSTEWSPSSELNFRRWISSTNNFLAWNKNEILEGISNYETKKYVYKLDQKSGEIIEERTYELFNDEWQLIPLETKRISPHEVKYGCYSKRKHEECLTLIAFDENKNLVFTKIQNETEEIIFRVSNDSIYLTGPENQYGTFLIEYN